MNKNLNDKVLDIIIEEAIEKYAHDIANEEVPCDMTDEEIKRMEQQKNRIYKKIVAKIKHRRLSYRKIIILAATLVVLMALALNTSAIRSFITRSYTYVTEKELTIITTSEGDKDKYANIVEFIRKDKIVIPGWLPPGTEVTEITDNITSLYFDFDGENRLDFSQNMVDEGTLSILTENNKVFVSDYTIMGEKGRLIDITSESNIRLYVAIWNSDSVQYQIISGYDERTTKKILDNLKYYN